MDVLKRLEVLAPVHHLLQELIVIVSQVVLGEVKGVGEGKRCEELIGVSLVVEKLALFFPVALGRLCEELPPRY